MSQAGGQSYLRLAMCQLTPKRELHLHRIALLSSSHEGTSVSSACSQKDEVHMMLKSLTEDSASSQPDPRRTFIAALVQAALRQVCDCETLTLQCDGTFFAEQSIVKGCVMCEGWPAGGEQGHIGGSPSNRCSYTTAACAACVEDAE